MARSQAELAQHAEQTQLQMAAAERQAQRNAARQQQMLEMTKAYHEATIGVRKMQLEEQKKRIDLATQLAARKFQGQQQATQYADQLMQEGFTEEDAYAKAMLRFGPEMGLTSGPMGSAFRQIEGPTSRGRASGDLTPTQLGTLSKDLPQMEAMAKRYGPGSSQAQILALTQAAIARAAGQSRGPGAATMPTGMGATNAPPRITIQNLEIIPSDQTKKKMDEDEKERIARMQQSMSAWPGFGGQ